MAIKQRSRSLQIRKEPLSSSFYQLEVLNSLTHQQVPSFGDKLRDYGCQELKPNPIQVLQINVGKLCNQSCAHCHVDAGPDRAEVMTRETMETCLEVLVKYNIPTIDITGGAPELNPHFRWLIEECGKLDIRVIDRCNLTILVSHPKYQYLPSFFALRNVHIMASLPYFTSLRTDKQRGEGVFEDSIKALKMLNEAGYAQEGSKLILDLIYNPTGAFLPGNQQELEREFRNQLERRYRIRFNNLYALTNLPISRFLEFLVQSGNYHEYMHMLVQSFNPSTISQLMCRNTISVSWDGYLYDCDFNQMLDLTIEGESQHISQFDPERLRQRNIVINQHCYGCTAGAGSSCGGALV
jgi:radical SAM/Cys-rich protein